MLLYTLLSSRFWFGGVCVADPGGSPPSPLLTPRASIKVRTLLHLSPRILKFIELTALFLLLIFPSSPLSSILPFLTFLLKLWWAHLTPSPRKKGEGASIAIVHSSPFPNLLLVSLYHFFSLLSIPIPCSSHLIHLSRLEHYFIYPLPTAPPPDNLNFLNKLNFFYF